MLSDWRRKLVAVGLVAGVALGTVGVVAVGQTPKPVVTDKAKTDDKPAKGWNENDQYPTTVPDIDPKKAEDVEAYRKKLPEVVVLEGDPPAVKAAKRTLLARMAQIEFIGQRIAAGQFTGSSAYLTATSAVSSVTETAAAIWDKPDQLLPWYAWRLAEMKAAESFIKQRVDGGLELDPATHPQLVAERYAAEIALLKLREKAKK